jgi:hypothetical protein
MTEELRKLEQARDLLREVEGRLRGRDSPEVEDHLTQLERLAESFPEGHMARLLIRVRRRERQGAQGGQSLLRREQVPLRHRRRDLDAAWRVESREFRAAKPLSVKTA